jgi:hypothetical protein
MKHSRRTKKNQSAENVFPPQVFPFLPPAFQPSHCCKAIFPFSLAYRPSHYYLTSKIENREANVKYDFKRVSLIYLLARCVQSELAVTVEKPHGLGAACMSKAPSEELRKKTDALTGGWETGIPALRRKKTPRSATEASFHYFASGDNVDLE